MATAAASDQNLLFGILALQMDFIPREALIASMNAWVLDKSRSLGDILVHEGQLSAARRRLLDALMREHVEQHDNDPRQSLAAIAPSIDVRRELSRLNDHDLETSLAEITGLVSLAQGQPLGADAVVDPYSTFAGAPTPAPANGMRYRVLRPHAKGGLGQVSVAMDEELSREVAFKEIQPRYADDPQSRARFIVEAEVTGGLEHPGIVPVYGLGRYNNGRPYYAMRFIRGDSFKEVIERFYVDGADQPLGASRLGELRKLLGTVIDACNAVAYAHSRGVLHRDIKPANIMLGRYGETLVVDWGLAKVLGKEEPSPDAETHALSPALDEPIQVPRRRVSLDEQPLRPMSASSSAPTQLGVTLGTPQFMSPEQAMGRLDRLGPASDVYSLGATLYYVLTGRAAFECPDLTETLKNVRAGNYPMPRQIRKDVPPPLEAICLKAMALAPSDRYRSPLDLADDLEHWLADDPVSAYPESRRQRLARWCRRHRAWTQAGLMVLVTIATTALVATAVIGRAWDHESEARYEVSQLLEQEKLERENALRMSHEAHELRREAERAHAEALKARQEIEESQMKLARQITQLGLEQKLRQSVQSKPLLWEIVADRIVPLHDKTRLPTSADTSMQSYAAFRRDRPQRLDGLTTLYVLPIGTFDEAGERRIEQTRDLLGRFFDLPAKTLPAVARLEIPPSQQQGGNGGAQVPAAWLLEKVVGPARPADAAVTVALTALDLTGDDGNSVFGHADPARPLAVASWNRLEPASGSHDAQEQLLRRTLKTAVYVTGLAIGMRDYAAYDCGMNAPATLADLDRKPLAFCPECVQKIWWVSDTEPLERYSALVEYVMQQHLDAEVKFWQRSLDIVRGVDQ